MKYPVIMQSFIVMILLLVMIVPVAAEGTISSVSPTVVYVGTSPSITITGSGFPTYSDTSSVKCRLMKDGENNESTTSISSVSSTQIVCKFSSIDLDTGSWDLVVINRSDDSETNVKGDAIDIRAKLGITSISPTSARTNNDSVEFTLTGTGLSDIDDVYLYNSDYENITATDVDADSSTKVTGEFDLTDANEDTYRVCVMDSAKTRKCDSSVTFDITSDAVGKMDLSSSPSGASIYIDSTLVGTTPYLAEDLTEGSHKVLIQKSGYTDWGKMIKVVSGSTTTVDADLAEITTQQTQAPAATPIPTVPTATARTTRVSTIKVPTTWPSTTATTQASPLGLLGIVGAVGFAFYVLRK